MLLFRSEEHLEAWRGSRGVSRGESMTVEQQWHLASLWYSNRMSAQWSRFRPQEAEDIFAEVGLTGDFWSLSQ
jgi:hypothetical protein